MQFKHLFVNPANINEARVIQDSFEHKFLEVYNAWLNMTDTPGVAHGKLLDPYVVTSELTDRLRPICVKFPQHHASLALMGAIRRFESSFVKLDRIRWQYHVVYSGYSTTLNSRNTKIETAANALSNRPRTDRNPWSTIFAKSAENRM